MKTNLRKHELIGLLLIFLAGTCFGFGLYITFWAALRPLYYNSLDYVIKGKDMFLFPLFYGLAFVLYSLGQIELKEAIPGRMRR
ncbi:hypothetical protein JXB41_06275 [Candidatus Woesearchaeota archaeon]|nr:hypothetical protein [Candidatus Woesearchaeota archaeon]